MTRQFCICLQYSAGERPKCPKLTEIHDKIDPLRSRLYNALGIVHAARVSLEHKETYARDVGLKDLLWKYQPSVCSKDELPHVTFALSTK